VIFVFHWTELSERVASLLLLWNVTMHRMYFCSRNNLLTTFDVLESHFTVICKQVKEQEAATSEAVQCIQQTITLLQKVRI